MRGDGLQQAPMFSYVSPEQRVPAEHPLRAIRAMADEALRGLSRRFSRLYARTGRPGIAPERLLRALLLQALYSIRSERLLMEQIDYNLLFRWFIGLTMDDAVWDASTFSQNRERLLRGDVAQAFFEQVRRQAERAGLLSDEHFSVDGTLIEAWAGQKSLRRNDDEPRPPAAGGRNPEVDFHGEKRSNQTHLSSTDPEAMLARKTAGSETKLAYRGHVLTENRHGLVVQARVTHAYGNAETHAALQMLAAVPGRQRLTCGADKGYDNGEFVGECRHLNVAAHAARKIKYSAVATRTAASAGYALSQVKRKRVEEVLAG
ncbi:MAG: IS5 family transposase [Terriglobales bacterium]